MRYFYPFLKTISSNEKKVSRTLRSHIWKVFPKQKLKKMKIKPYIDLKSDDNNVKLWKNEPSRDTYGKRVNTNRLSHREVIYAKIQKALCPVRCGRRALIWGFHCGPGAWS